MSGTDSAREHYHQGKGVQEELTVAARTSCETALIEAIAHAQRYKETDVALSLALALERVRSGR